MTTEAPAPATDAQSARLRAMASNAERVFEVAGMADGALAMDRDDYRVMAMALREAADALAERDKQIVAFRKIVVGLNESANLHFARATKAEAERDEARMMYEGASIVDQQHIQEAADRIRKAEAALAERDKDAERYRWLRAQHWNDGKFCVVREPSKSVKLGHDCPSDERLDAAIDAAIDAAKDHPGL